MDRSRRRVPPRSVAALARQFTNAFLHEERSVTVLLVHAGEAMAMRWRDALRAADPSLDVRIYPEIGDERDIECLLTWKPPAGLVPRLTRLLLLQCSGAGVDQLLEEEGIPPGLPIARIVDRQQANDLTVFALAVTLAWFRRLDEYARFQTEGRWERLFPHPTVSDLTVGVLGLGTVGRTLASRFAACGFRVLGWSRSPAALQGIETLAGADALPALAGRCHVLLCALPLTPQTRGILARPLLCRLARPAFLVNLGRGGHLVDQDLLAMLDEGAIDGAALDVHRQEPLPADHAFWSHQRIRVTPHIGAFATPERVSTQIVENLRRVRRGEPPLHPVDLARGY
jgi:glyoxylate/hydroxypyruvate reductase A